MSSKIHALNASSACPPIGTLLTAGATGGTLVLRLVEVLEYSDDYDIVYRAEGTTPVTRRSKAKLSYTVRCLATSSDQTRPQETRLHKLVDLHRRASSHPGVLNIHHVVEEEDRCCIIMDYAPDHNLGVQILEKCRYLGFDTHIKDIFLQVLDAVQHCHSLGIYHQNLTVENVLCFDDGLRVAITNFEHATTDILSDEFDTDDLYHLSPECQAGQFAPTGNYSPMFNDVWSLAIILLYVVTGRPPWRSATHSDVEFQAYLRDPTQYLLRTFPISPELNRILTQMLEVDWRSRMSLRDVRSALEQVSNFYVDDVIFEGNNAWCSWQYQAVVKRPKAYESNESHSNTLVDISLPYARPQSSIFSDYLPNYVPSFIDSMEDGNYNLVAAALAKMSIRSYTCLFRQISEGILNLAFRVVAEYTAQKIFEPVPKRFFMYTIYLYVSFPHLISGTMIYYIRGRRERSPCGIQVHRVIWSGGPVASFEEVELYFKQSAMDGTLVASRVDS